MHSQPGTIVRTITIFNIYSPIFIGFNICKRIHKIKMSISQCNVAPKFWLTMLQKSFDVGQMVVLTLGKKYVAHPQARIIFETRQSNIQLEWLEMLLEYKNVA